MGQGIEAAHMLKAEYAWASGCTGCTAPQLLQKKWGAGISAEPHFQQVTSSAAAAAVLAKVLLQGAKSVQLAAGVLPAKCGLPTTVVCTLWQALLQSTDAAV